MHNGEIGADVTRLQRLLNQAGFKIAIDGIYGPATEQAVTHLQRRAGLVADGIAGPKTIAALESGDRNTRHLSEAALQQAADRLGVTIAAIKAVNQVESNGSGYLVDGRPVILYERHVAWRLLAEVADYSEERIAELVARHPNLIHPKRGAYIGGPGEWSRLFSATQIIPQDIAHAACSWGQYQIMGYHWPRLGYESLAAFIAAMRASEAAQLDAFVRYIESEPPLHKAIKSRKWTDFARLYNGPDYKANLYDVKLQRAYERYAEVAA